MQSWLLAKMIVVAVGGKSSFMRRVYSYTASLVAFADATYSASIDEVTTVCYFLKDHEIELPAMLKINLEVKQWSSRSYAQLEPVTVTKK